MNLSDMDFLENWVDGHWGSTAFCWFWSSPSSSTLYGPRHDPEGWWRAEFGPTYFFGSRYLKIQMSTQIFPIFSKTKNFVHFKAFRMRTIRPNAPGVPGPSVAKSAALTGMRLSAPRPELLAWVWARAARKEDSSGCHHAVLLFCNGQWV